MHPDEFRRHAHELVDWMADYMTRVGELPVTPPVAPGDIRRHPPRLGEHSAEVLGEAGYTAAEVAAMIRSGATVAAGPTP